LAAYADSFVCWKQLTDRQIDEAIAGDVHWETGPINQIQMDLVHGAREVPHQSRSELQTRVVQFGDLMTEQSNHTLVTAEQWALHVCIGPNSIPNAQDMMASQWLMAIHCLHWDPTMVQLISHIGDLMCTLFVRPGWYAVREAQLVRRMHNSPIPGGGPMTITQRTQRNLSY
jgi:hypothetical protein